MWTPRFLMRSDGETVPSPVVKEQHPYVLRWCFDVKIIILVLSSFNFNMCNAIHCLTSAIQSVSRLAVSTWSPGVAGLYDAYKWMSSAYLWYFMPCLLNIRCIGVVYKVNTTGPRTEPCGTPICSGIVADVVSLSRHSGCGLPNTSGTTITPFHAHRIRHATVLANVHGQSCQMHLISPAWQTTLRDSFLLSM